MPLFRRLPAVVSFSTIAFFSLLLLLLTFYTTTFTFDQGHLPALVNLGTDQEITGLPSDFQPATGYYSQFGLIGLWDRDGNYYIAEDGQEFRELSPADLDLPSGFTSTVSYSHRLHGDSMVGLWDESDYYIWTADADSIQSVDLASAYPEIPGGFTPVLGYWHGFGDGMVSLWDEAGYNYLWNSQTDSFSVLSPEEISDLGLPKGEAPQVGYYHDSSIGGQQAVSLWYEGGDHYRLDGNELIDSSTSGLPSGAPDVGYFDEINNRIVLWYGERMYGSGDGVNFELLYHPQEEITPSATLSADPETVEQGESTTLIWETQDTESCDSQGFSTDDQLEGSTQADITQDTTFELECESATGHTASDSVTVTVIEPKEPEADHENYPLKDIERIEGGTQGVVVVPETEEEIEFKTEHGQYQDKSLNCEQSEVWGDVNGSGIVNAVDIQIVINGVLGVQEEHPCMDINRDGEVDAVDIQLVINAALGIEPDIELTARINWPADKVPESGEEVRVPVEVSRTGGTGPVEDIELKLRGQLVSAQGGDINPEITPQYVVDNKTVSLAEGQNTATVYFDWLVLGVGEHQLSFDIDWSDSSEENTDSQIVESRAPIGETVGEQRVAVLLFSFEKDLDDRLWSPEEIYQKILGQGAESANTFFRENSYYQTWLTGEVYGWKTIPAEECPGVEGAIPHFAEEVDFSRYDIVKSVFPYHPDCDHGGMASEGKWDISYLFDAEEKVRIAVSYSMGDKEGSLNYGTIKHELGHNFGLHHASSFDCGDQVSRGNCRFKEYGDTFSIMGSLHSNQLNVAERYSLNWLPSSMVEEVDESGIFNMESLDFVTPGLKTVRVVDEYDIYNISDKNNLSQDFVNWFGFRGEELPEKNREYARRQFHLVYHRPETEDWLSLFGLTAIYDGPWLMFNYADNRSKDTLRVNFQPRVSQAFTPRRLELGESYQSSVTGSQIFAKEMTEDNEIKIEAQNAAVGNCIQHSPYVHSRWTIINTDSTWCEEVRFEFSLKDLPEGWEGSVTPSQLSLEPGELLDIRDHIDLQVLGDAEPGRYRMTLIIEVEGRPEHTTEATLVYYL